MTSSLSLTTLEYGHDQPLFSPMSIHCHAGEIWAIIGANGRGKSTLLDTITGVLPAISGSVHVSGGAAIVPQSFRPAFAWRVRDVVLMGRARHIALFAQPKREDEQQVMLALEALNIGGLADAPFHALSGGQQQLVMIARALVSASQNILLDEPCSALDLANQQTVLQLISNLAHQQARTVMFTTHDPTHALQIASHTLLLLPDGEWLAGATHEVVQEVNLQRAYGLPVRRVQLDDYACPVLAPLFSIHR
ncbi:ABC transporter ATP-binding protein [Pseudocitrobacter cyperus]|uniref:ABC transporter ATP-binding protein n=1 Tax=Pseudocitrobacter cyperus TaxID=3112843 RepID=A0ABV0HE48_9ENTR